MSVVSWPRHVDRLGQLGDSQQEIKKDSQQERNTDPQTCGLGFLLGFSKLAVPVEMPRLCC